MRERANPSAGEIIQLMIVGMGVLWIADKIKAEGPFPAVGQAIETADEARKRVALKQLGSDVTLGLAKVQCCFVQDNGNGSFSIVCNYVTFEGAWLPPFFDLRRWVEHKNTQVYTGDRQHAQDYFNEFGLQWC